MNAIRTAGLNYTTEALNIHEKFDSKFGVQTVNDALVVLKTLIDRYFLRGVVDFMGMLYLPLIHPEVHNDIYSPQILILDETTIIRHYLKMRIGLSLVKVAK